MLVRVLSICQETPQTKVFELVSSDGISLPGHTAGSHISVEVRLANGAVESRSYSIINPPCYQGYYQIAVQRESSGRGGSAYLHDCVAVGDFLNIEGPKNHFPLVDDATKHVFIAGGIGITPILCMAKTAAINNQPFELHYSARTQERMALRKEVTGLCGAHAALWFDDGNPEKGMNLENILGEYKDGAHVYTCGPAGLIDAVLGFASRKGWPEPNIHFELFNNPQAGAHQGDRPIDVELAHTGITLRVEPGTTILDALLAAGVDADYDCKVGECGSCLTTVLDGVPLHRDYYLNKNERAESKSMCTCVSWAQSPRLVLDI